MAETWYTERDAVGLAELIAKGEVTPAETVEAALAVIEVKIASGAVRPFEGVTLQGPDFALPPSGGEAEPLRAAG